MDIHIPAPCRKVFLRSVACSLVHGYLAFVDPWDFRVLGLDVGVGFVHLYARVFVFCWTCFYGFLAFRTSFASCSLFTFYLLDLRVYFLQDFCNLCLCNLAPSSFQPGMRLLSGVLHVYAYVTFLFTVLSPTFFSPK